ncbi:DUF2339 domain-containing protein [Luteimonas sp. MC1750]|uniref:DUF2339 domain-containing protein n=1 Tax=Luteimonas sp. MC1750 TaxID=2799326 RepID=UPI0018F0A353|nr:DUF2339 domain-containing protein [Luteimonas sp. MC1750]MBJ6983235.1 DUF2339 domain-containing protein [Luteimonas sp. MC1750]QQO05500.1 DUF2339 domain-containing protein [Luteimonas sp. MC1750]
MESMLMLLGLAVLSLPVLLVVALVGLGDLKRRVAELEAALARVQTPSVQAQAKPGTAPLPAAWLDAAAMSPPSPRSGSTPEPRPTPTPTQTPATVSASRAPSPAPARRVEPIAAEARRAPASPPPFDRLANAVRRWFTEGNVPVKVGVLVLLAGVAALLRYASNQGWLTLPIGLRLAAIAAAALMALAFAWRKRSSHRSFALAVQGGAIGVLLLVVYAAFKLYAMLPAGAAFAISVVLVAALGALAVLQGSRTLAVLGILAGFMAPIWLSSGSGNHVVLFSYYALLNAAIFAIAWLRPWRELNLLGWIFTWGIGVAWGVLAYEPSKFATTQPFLLLFFAFYLLLPILYARRRPPGRRDVVDGCLLFGTPLIAFSLQAALLEGERTQLALCAVALAAIYAALAWWQRRGPHAVLAEAYVLLAGGFATLAVPLALSARATAAVFAVEGAALVWLGLRTGRGLPRWIGTCLQLAAAVSFSIGVAGHVHDAPVLANARFTGALLLAMAGFASAWWYRGAGRTPAALAFYLWGLAWWLGNAVQEVDAHVASGLRADVLLVAVALTTLLAAEAHRWRPAPALVLTVLGAFVLAAPLAILQMDAHGQPFAGWGAAAWLAFAACGVRSLACLRTDGGQPAAWSQFAWWLLWALVGSLSAWELARDMALGGGWRLALPALPWLALLALGQFRWRRLRWPLGPGFDAMHPAFMATCLALVGVGWLRALRDAGDSAPLPWLPLVNPLDLVQLAALGLFARWLWSSQAPAFARRRVALLSSAGFLLVTCITLRAVHHWGGVPWGEGLWSTSLAQTALTVVWSVLGVAGWIGGSRRGQRVLWLAGAVLMAVVLAKLVLVDRQHLGDLLGIGSFIAYGLLCTLVGWFAPAPPRAPPGAAGS